MKDIKLRKLKDTDWTHGAGEMISFLFVFPFQLLVILLTVISAEVSIVDHKLNYVNYIALRAACIAGSDTAANTVVKQILQESLPVGKMGIIGAEPSDTFSLETVNHATWKKGSMATLSIYVETNYFVFEGVSASLAGKIANRSSTLTMMIESPAGSTNIH